ncbi:MAG: penicillin-binding protein 2 [Clostridium sp.]|uniref:peptidoglycan D,D-transpeptidase FtsI family protein n=1 Tax=Clostridium sp. TaxID=1506 RepID=UPI00290FCECA|nr:penicillin-binding protein 2 [Clostridium sp.]MDU7339261.1 penicillin-binding protein 2 [Clostridium sp.]
MSKRVAAFYSIFMVCLLLLVTNLYRLSTGNQLAEAADRQSSYRLTVASGRGTVYDTNLKPLTGTEIGYTAVVNPTPETASILADVLPRERMEEVYTLLTKGKPFLLTLPKAVQAEGIDTFETYRRYNTNDQIAANVIGYLDGSNIGVAGMEKAYQDYLSADPGGITVSYRVDAVNRVLSGENKEIKDTSEKNKKGVVLTLDEEIQKIAEKSAKKYLKKGAVVVTEVPSGKIRAMVSLPDFSPTDLKSAMDNPDSPLMNRAISAYSVGSVFKVVSAAAALESGVSPDTTFTCTGGIEVGGGVYHCFNGKAHGKLNMQGAIAHSCNSYFVRLMQQIPNETLLKMAQSLGFGQSQSFAPGYTTAAGSLPEQKELLVPRALANFSFGQGKLSATPVQIAGLINAVASGGLYTPPSLVEGLVDDKMQYVERAKSTEAVRVMSQDTAAQLRQFMGAAVEEGTAKKGKPVLGGAGIKTGTAQTGQYVGNKEVEQGWYAGFFPLNTPRYSIVVLSEDAQGASDGAPVFQEIANALLSKTN